ncbi:DapH/DapD/GlmU-related protein [Cedecea sp.]|jgi:maltose O-acetyltransferase|uniref:DapH/DapD/GlmU-related protein n=1 Tax=Cedecea sp. TaxID=1970739 RepID=UPI0012AD2B89|nr:sugar O-acetyltransferase [Enterobacteriaceae bacterium RIT693]
MLTYFLCNFAKSVKVPVARNLINSKSLSRKKRNRLLAKSGVSFRGESTVTTPFFYEFGHISIGHNVYINAGCVFLDNAAIKIGDNSLIGPNVTLSTASHPCDPVQRNTTVISAPITLGRNVWLGAGVVVLPGVTIGENSIIAANSVVNVNVPENVLYAGAPAIFKRHL